jgi:hypothetical protein
LIALSPLHATMLNDSLLLDLAHRIWKHFFDRQSELDFISGTLKPDKSKEALNL